jgi:hypothetical protein
MANMRGFDITMDWKPNADGQVMAHIRVKRWYVPFLLLRGLRQCHFPLRYWPLAFWRYYTKHGVK